MGRRKGSKNKRTLAREAARNVATQRAKILGTDLPDVTISLDSLDVMEEVMRHFYIKAKVEQSLGPKADWKAVDAAMLQAAAMAKEIAPYKHQRLAALRIAGEIKSGPADGATLDELLERIKRQLTKLGPILDLEVMCEPEGSRRSATRPGRSLRTCKASGFAADPISFRLGAGPQNDPQRLSPVVATGTSPLSENVRGCDFH